MALSPSGSAAEARRLRVAFFGTPDFALPSLEALHRHHEVVLVVSQPDRRLGRGMRTQTPPVAQRAAELGLPLVQPERLRKDVAFRERLAELAPDVAVTAAYGQILPAELLAVPREGFLNVHASLLPRWRGAAPVQHALIAGDPVTGVSIMQTEVGLDTGPVRLVRPHPIPAGSDAAELATALAQLGAEAITEALAALIAGGLPSHPQDDAQATLAPRLTREDGRVRWTDSAEAIGNRHRGVTGWPGSWCQLGEGEQAQVLKLLRLHPAKADLPATAAGGEPGEVLAIDAHGLLVACGRDAVRLEQVQAAGRKPQAARDWANGARLRKGARLG